MSVTKRRKSCRWLKGFHSPCNSTVYPTRVKRFTSKNGCSERRKDQSEFRQIQLLLEQHAFIVRDGKKQDFSEARLLLPEKVLEDIKGKSKFPRRSSDKGSVTCSSALLFRFAVRSCPNFRQEQSESDEQRRIANRSGLHRIYLWHRHGDSYSGHRSVNRSFFFLLHRFVLVLGKRLVKFFSNKISTVDPFQR